MIIICQLYFNITLTTITEVAPGIQTDSTSHQICDIPLWRYRYNCQFRIREDYAKHFLHYCRILCQYLEKYVIMNTGAETPPLAAGRSAVPLSQIKAPA